MEDDRDQNSAGQRGYGKPPREYRFKKGQSGNPRGRPRKVPPATMAELMQRALDKEIEIKVNGIPVNMPRREVIVERGIQDALAGKKGAIKTLQDIVTLPVMQLVQIEDPKLLTFRIHEDSLIPTLDLLERQLKDGL